MNLKWYKSFLHLMCVLNHLKCAASDSITVAPFGHPALVQLYCRFVNTEQRDLKVVIALTSMALQLALRGYSSRIITCCIMNLQGTELLDYTMLVDDLIA
ncbi:hypothetical protein F5J12DRAFT_849480 [Pisolithus orientalis]|uniref:uncharacterized protein n=1 Tax=Pisolithus orientalis TaxID=936130 RepID=UPI0022249313|nr:uncharacterized protein F5J12DRAFT_849480 [Pisolithus orientalis]KAI5998549.1 hypothetical protein F5J12DRAFT_849480 [Pisolithus orientalis]